MPKSKILVIEDEIAIRENIVELLEMAGHEVLSAENGQLNKDSGSQEEVKNEFEHLFESLRYYGTGN